jgi:hypothetical protein
MLITARAYIISGTFEGRLMQRGIVDFLETHKHSSLLRRHLVVLTCDPIRTSVITKLYKFSTIKRCLRRRL